MEERYVYSFPTLKDGRIAIEEVYCKYITEQRNGANLDPEVLDWMDAANNWLMTVGNGKL